MSDFLTCDICGHHADPLWRTSPFGVEGTFACASCRDKHPSEIVTEDMRPIMECTVLRWTCACELCNRYTRVKDYGLFPWVYWKKEWINVSENYMGCARHFKMLKAGKIDPVRRKNHNCIIQSSNKTSVGV